MPLDVTDRAILEFEGSWWTEPGSKADRIRGALGCSPTAYYRRLARLAADGDALDEFPLVVRRVRRRLRDQREERITGVPSRGRRGS